LERGIRKRAAKGIEIKVYQSPKIKWHETRPRRALNRRQGRAVFETDRWLVENGKRARKEERRRPGGSGRQREREGRSRMEGEGKTHLCRRWPCMPDEEVVR